MQQLLETLKGSDDPIAAIRDAGLRPKFAANDHSRVLVSHDRMGEHGPLGSVANGLVYDSTTKTVLCVPSRSLTYNPNFPALVAAMSGEVTIYAANDGTTVNLYHDGKRWCMGTIHAWDVSGYTWIGPKTYREQFEAAAHQYGFKWELLDPTITYTVGFRCADFHGLPFDPPRCWLISAQSRDTMGTVPVTTTLPNQVTVSKPDGGSEAAAKYLSDQAAGALKSTLTALRTGAVPSVNYGYIIQTASTTWYLESSLMRKIRTCLYNLPKSGVALDNNSRLTYALVKTYLNSYRHDEFLGLFPQHANTFQLYTRFFNEFTDRVINLLRNRNARKIDPSNLFDALALSFVNGICKTEGLNPLASGTVDIVREFVRDPARIADYIPVILLYGSSPPLQQLPRGAGGARKK